LTEKVLEDIINALDSHMITGKLVIVITNGVPRGCEEHLIQILLVSICVIDDGLGVHHGEGLGQTLSVVNISDLMI